MNLGDKIFPKNHKGIAKGLKMYGFGVVKYSVRSESGIIIAIQSQSYYVSGLLFAKRKTQ